MIVKRGVAVSPGVAIGPAMVLGASDYRIPRRFIRADSVDAELARFRSALDSVCVEITTNEQLASEQIGKQYGVAPQYIVAIVGVETSYGRNTGKYKVLDALVTLGLYYPPRAKFFREQLKELLSMPGNHLAGPIDTLTGSYAGAQGWGQFMPTSIRDFAVDADHDGHIDLQNSLPDIFASVANYFVQHGWVSGGPVAARAQPDGAAQQVAVKDATPQWPLEQFEAWGYAPLQPLSPAEPTSLQTLEGPNGPEYWFTFQNFYVITRYNRSPLYAMAVDQLAQAIAAGVGQAEVAR